MDDRLALVFDEHLPLFETWKNYLGPAGEPQSSRSLSFFSEKTFGRQEIAGQKHVPDPFLQDFAILLLGPDGVFPNLPGQG